MDTAINPTLEFIKRMQGKIRCMGITECIRQTTGLSQYDLYNFINKPGEQLLDKDNLNDILSKIEVLPYQCKYILKNNRLNSTDSRYDEMIRMRVEDNLSYTEIGKVYNITRERVRQILKRNGADGPKVSCLEEHKEEAIKEYLSGCGVMFLVKKYNVSNSTLTEFLKKNNIQPVKKIRNKRSSKYDKDTADIIKMYTEDKMNMASIGKKYNVFASQIKRILDLNGIETRSKVSKIDSYTDEIIRLYTEENKTINELSRKYESSPSQVRKVLISHGVKIRR